MCVPWCGATVARPTARDESSWHGVSDHRADHGESATLPPSTAPAVLTRPLLAVMAVACGVSVANIYYGQPLLHTIAADLHTGSGTAGLVVTGSQVGYAVGLALVVPLGDILDRRRLIPAVLAATAAALLGMAAAPTAGALIVLAVPVGVGSVVAQILVPMAAGLATDGARGHVVGVVMAGLLMGILGARTVAGLVAQAAGWRAVFVLAAGLMALLALVLSRTLPADRPRPRLGYRALQRSTVAIAAREPLLRRRTLVGALSMAAFSVFWTTMAFVLARPPFGYDNARIGLFGLVGVAGAVVGVFAGRWVDRGRSAATSVVFAATLTAAFAVLTTADAHVATMIAGVLLLDIAVQGMQITNQSLVYGLPGEARSRVTSFYMVGYFAGGAAGSAGGALTYSRFGWTGVCILGMALGAAAVGAVVRWRAPASATADAPEPAAP